MTSFRIAGAPISWGVCEVPGWGYQLSPGRVLGEMRDVGLAATELGPDGFLPADPEVEAIYNPLDAVGPRERLGPAPVPRGDSDESRPGVRGRADDGQLADACRSQHSDS